MPKNSDYRNDLLADLRNDLGYAAEYLSAAYADSREAFLVALRDVAEAQKGMASVAKEARINRENLYRTLSKRGNPTIGTIGSVLDVLGLQFKIVPQDEATLTSGDSPTPVTNISGVGMASQVAASTANTIKSALDATMNFSLWTTVQMRNWLETENSLNAFAPEKKLDNVIPFPAGGTTIQQPNQESGRMVAHGRR